MPQYVRWLSSNLGVIHEVERIAFQKMAALLIRVT